MAFWQCEDPFVRKVRELYRANVIRAPRTGIIPFQVVARRGDHLERRGDLVSLIVGDDPVQLPTVESGIAADLSGESSASVDADLGLELTAKFLKALGVPIPGASVDVTFLERRSKIIFQVLNVREQSVNVSRLGTSLKGRRIDPDHPSAGVYFGEDKADLLVITRILTSPSFAVETERKRGSSAEINVDAIKDLIGEASVKFGYSRSDKSAVFFSGRQHAAFAFGAVPFHLEPDGSFKIGLEVSGGSLLQAPRPGQEIRPTIPIDAPVVEDDILLDFDDG
jgi:hypothetical protein